MKENKVRTQKNRGVMGYSVARLTGSEGRKWKAVAYGHGNFAGNAVASPS